MKQVCFQKIEFVIFGGEFLWRELIFATGVVLADKMQYTASVRIA
jgi:hypothetical protein